MAHMCSALCGHYPVPHPLISGVCTFLLQSSHHLSHCEKVLLVETADQVRVKGPIEDIVVDYHSSIPSRPQVWLAVAAHTTDNCTSFPMFERDWMADQCHRPRPPCRINKPQEGLLHKHLHGLPASPQGGLPLWPLVHQPVACLRDWCTIRGIGQQNGPASSSGEELLQLVELHQLEGFAHPGHVIVSSSFSDDCTRLRVELQEVHHRGAGHGRNDVGEKALRGERAVI